MPGVGNCDGSLDYRDTAGWFNLLAGYCRLAQKKKSLKRGTGALAPLPLPKWPIFF